jgi:integrase
VASFCGKFFNAGKNRHHRPAQKAAGHDAPDMDDDRRRSIRLEIGLSPGARGGVWIGKLVSDGMRVQAALGAADDGSGKGLSYIDALTAAAAWAGKEKARLEESANEKADRVVTVADAIETYVKMRIARAERAGRDAETRLARHVLSDARLATLPVGRVTARTLNDWRSRLPATLASAGTNRLLNDFRAALNAHVAAYWRDLPASVGKEIETGLKALPNAQTARQALLSDSDVRKDVDAAYGVDPDLGALALILASTGARFSQAARITVADLQPEAGRVMVPASKKGKGVKQRRHSAVPLGPDAVERLKRLTIGRGGHEPLLTRWVSRQVGRGKWEHVDRSPWLHSSEMAHAWRKALAAAGVPHVEAYALRHSSIVRGLRSGVPVRIVAALHDTSTSMIEMFYSAHILDAADELARRAIVPLTSEPPATLSIVA